MWFSLPVGISKPLCSLKYPLEWVAECWASERMSHSYLTMASLLSRALKWDVKWAWLLWPSLYPASPSSLKCSVRSAAVVLSRHAVGVHAHVTVCSFVLMQSAAVLLQCNLCGTFSPSWLHNTAQRVTCCHVCAWDGVGWGSWRRVCV